MYFWALPKSDLFVFLKMLKGNVIKGNKRNWLQQNTIILTKRSKYALYFLYMYSLAYCPHELLWKKNWICLTLTTNILRSIFDVCLNILFKNRKLTVPKWGQNDNICWNNNLFKKIQMTVIRLCWSVTVIIYVFTLYSFEIFKLHILHRNLYLETTFRTNHLLNLVLTYTSCHSRSKINTCCQSLSVFVGGFWIWFYVKAPCTGRIYFSYLNI